MKELRRITYPKYRGMLEMQREMQYLPMKKFSDFQPKTQAGDASPQGDAASPLEARDYTVVHCESCICSLMQLELQYFPNVCVDLLRAE